MRQVAKVIAVASLAWLLGLGLFIADGYRVFGTLFANPVRRELPSVSLVLLLSLLLSASMLYLAALRPRRRRLSLHVIAAACLGLVPALVLTLRSLVGPSEGHLEPIDVIKSFGSFYVIIVIMCLTFGWAFQWATRPANYGVQLTAGAGVRSSRAPTNARRS